MKIRDFPRESYPKIVCGSAAFPLLFAACKLLQPVVDPTGMFSMTTLGLLAVYVTGLLLLDRHRSTCRIGRTVIPGRSHDRMTGLLGWVGHFHLLTRPFPSLASGLVHTIVATTGVPGLLILDDTLLPKRFAKALWGVYWDRDPATGKVVPGICMVWGIWTTGWLVLPVGFLLWHTQGHLPADVRRYRTKNALTQALVWPLHARGVRSGLPGSYLLCDGWYGTQDNLRRFQRLAVFYITRFALHDTVRYRGRVEKARGLAWTVGKSRWHYDGASIGSITSFAVIWPGVGPLKLAVVTATRQHPPQDRLYLVSNDPTRSHLALFALRAHRWTVEMLQSQDRKFIRG